MGGDVSDAAKIGFGLILLVTLIGMVMYLLKMVKVQTNEGSVSLSRQYAKVAESEFDGYNQVKKTGVDIPAAVKVFEDRPISIVVKTISQIKAGTRLAYNYGAWLTTAYQYAGVASGRNLVAVEINDIPDNGALCWDAEKNCYVARLEVNHTTGAYKYNKDCTPMDKASTDSFINPAGSFTSYLIKDENNANIGILFMQDN